MKPLLIAGGLVALTLSASLADPATPSDPSNSVNNRQQAVTSGDQSNAQSDVDITARIRRHVVKDDSLSTDAKNVKIVTSEGKVMLIGPVDSAAEKRIVRQHAEKVVGKTNVDDQLTVK